MPLADRLRTFFSNSGKRQRVSLEIRPDGIAWSLAGKAPAMGFAECTPARRQSVLESLVSENHLGGADATIVLPMDQYQVFQLERPEGVDDAELADALKWKLKDFLDFSPSEAVSDVFPFPADAARGRGDLVNVVAVRRTVISELVTLADDAGLKLQQIDIAELALRNFLGRLDDTGRGATLVQLKEHYGHMVIGKGGTLYLSRRLDVTARELREASSQESAVQSLALEMQRSLDYYESQLGQVPPPVINLVARDSLLPLTSMLGSWLAAGTRTVDWDQFGLDAEPDSRCLVAWSSALGLPEVTE
ncbi:biogenesis protein MshI [Marinobacter bryozoorum]|uniref:biogenesis protein MshI n=1 Tax=Marinobacter bryozoorum TaxID=256324 RepID=UPI0020039787|nr:biogenesis protein MshI [Marinobacter bryozoorum]